MCFIEVMHQQTSKKAIILTDIYSPGKLQSQAKPQMNWLNITAIKNLDFGYVASDSINCKPKAIKKLVNSS